MKQLIKNIIYTQNKPSFMILGAQKSATSSLYNLLIQHPDIIAPIINKEIGFFNNEIEYFKGIKHYYKNFPKTRRKYHTLDATPEYLYLPACAERIYNYNNDLKFILILREPIERAYSAWNFYRFLIDKRFDFLMKRMRKTEKHTNISQMIKLLERNPFPSFEEFLEEETNIMENNPDILFPGLIRYGFYDEQIARYFNLFDRKQFLVLAFSEFIKDPKLTVSKSLKFLNIKESTDYYNLLDASPINKKNYKEKINTITKNSLKEIFKPHTENLKQLLEVAEFNY